MVTTMPKEVSLLAVVFDLDDTLFPERCYVRSGYRAVAEHLRRMLRRRDALEDRLWRRFLAGKTEGAFDALNDHFDLRLTGEQILELVSVYREHKPSIRPWPGVPAMLSRLHAQFRLGLLSDGFLPAQRLKLDALKLGRFFDAVVFTEEMGREAWKPSPIGFEAIRAELDVPHEACAYVADNPAKDFLAPNGLGWRTVQYLRPGQVHAHKPPPRDEGLPQAVVRSPGELLEALRD